MPGSSQSKLKLFCLNRILEELTDDEHPLTINEIINELSKYGINAERKSIYYDLSLLEEAGIDICRVHGKTHGYFVGQRQFEQVELRLLADAVQIAKFISTKKSKELIKKIEGLTSRHLAKDIDRQLFLSDRIKCENEEVYYNVDKIHSAIANNRKISFQYFDYDIHKDRVFRNEGMEYLVNPYGLTWSDDNYYMVANHDKYTNVVQYRVDRMVNVNIVEQKRRDPSEISIYKSHFNTADYSKKLYNMYSGELELVVIRFKKHVMNSVIDRFGIDIPVIEDGEDYFKISNQVAVSDGFISWILMFGDNAEVISPQSLREKIIEKVVKIKKLYD
jgi:predicted DNA-binding transcriptional regulator YafY